MHNLFAPTHPYTNLRARANHIMHLHQDRSPHILLPLSQAEKLLALLKNIETATTDYT